MNKKVKKIKTVHLVRRIRLISNCAPISRRSLSLSPPYFLSLVCYSSLRSGKVLPGRKRICGLSSSRSFLQFYNHLLISKHLSCNLPSYSYKNKKTVICLAHFSMKNFAAEIFVGH